MTKHIVRDEHTKAGHIIIKNRATQSDIWEPSEIRLQTRVAEYGQSDFTSKKMGVQVNFLPFH